MPVEPAVDSYGSADGVAAYCQIFLTDGAFFDVSAYVDATSPDLTTVVNWIDEVSAMLNIALENYGFKVPLTEERAVIAAGAVVNEVVADRVKYIKNQGRFFSDKPNGNGLLEMIAEYLDAWVKLYAPGLEAAGEERSGLSIKFGVRTHDEQGNETFPIFQRNAFGNRFISPKSNDG